MQTVSTPSTSSKWQQIVARMPRPDPEDKILQNVEEGQVEKVVAELLAGGGDRALESVHALVDMLGEGGAAGAGSPAAHALHALVMHVTEPRDRRRVAVSLAAALENKERPAEAKRFVIQQLQLCGTPAVANEIGKCLRDEALYQDAAMALLAIRTGAAEQFRAALSDATGPQRVAAVQALGTLRDAEAAPALRRTAERDPDPVARLEAALALARIGDGASAGILLTAADDATGFDRVRATDACLLLADNLAAGGQRHEADRIYRHLLDTRTEESEAYLRDLAKQRLAESDTPSPPPAPEGRGG